MPLSALCCGALLAALAGAALGARDKHGGGGRYLGRVVGCPGRGVSESRHKA